MTQYFFPEFEITIEADSQVEAMEKLHGRSKNEPEDVQSESKTLKKWTSSKK